MKLCGLSVRGWVSLLIVGWGLAGCQQDEDAVRSNLGRNGNRGAGRRTNVGTRHANGRVDRSAKPRSGARGLVPPTEKAADFHARLIGTWSMTNPRMRAGVKEKLAIVFNAKDEFEIRTLRPTSGGEIEIRSKGTYRVGSYNYYHHSYDIDLDFGDPDTSRVVVPAAGARTLTAADTETVPAAGSPEEKLANEYLSEYSSTLPGKAMPVRDNTLHLFDLAPASGRGTPVQNVHQMRGYLPLIKR
jgi:hypothetical protein